MPTNHGHSHLVEQYSDEPGALMHWPRRYDLLAAVALAGRGRRLRTDIARQLDLQPGQRVLDAGCGTGTLTLTLAKRRRPGWLGRWGGSRPGVIAAAAAKARQQRIPARLQLATAQDLPFADASMDAVVTSLMLHHLPPTDRPLASQVTSVAALQRRNNPRVVPRFPRRPWTQHPRP